MGAPLVFDRIRQRFNWLELVWADGGYNAREVERAVAAQPPQRLEIVKRPDDSGFIVLPRGLVVERTFSWFGRNRRWSKIARTSLTPRGLRHTHLHPARRQAARQAVDF